MTTTYGNRQAGSSGTRKQFRNALAITFTGGETAFSQPVTAAGFVARSGNQTWQARLVPGGGSNTPAVERAIYGLTPYVAADGAVWLSGGVAVAASPATIEVDFFLL